MNYNQMATDRRQASAPAPAGVRRRKRTIATISVSTVLPSSRSRQLQSTSFTILQQQHHQHHQQTKNKAQAAPENERRAPAAEEAPSVAAAAKPAPPVSLLAPDPVGSNGNATAVHNLDAIAIVNTCRIGSNRGRIAAAVSPRASAPCATAAARRSSDCIRNVKCEESLSSLSSFGKYQEKRPKRMCRKKRESYYEYGGSSEDDNDEDEDAPGNNDEDEGSNYRNEDQSSDYDDDDDLNKSDGDCDEDEDESYGDGDHPDQVDDEARNKNDDNDKDNESSNGKKHEHNSPEAKRKAKPMARSRSKDDERGCEDEDDGRDGDHTDQVDDEARNNDDDSDNDCSKGKKHENNDSPVAAAKRNRTKMSLLDHMWNQKFRELKEFKRQTGHCNVPRKTLNATPLSTWVSEMRRKYVSNKLPVERVKALNKLNFQWVFFGSRGSHWYSMFEELKAFKKKFGYFNVKNPKGKGYEYNKLGLWITAQKTAYRMGKLPQDRIKAMESINFTLQVRSSPKDLWMPMYLQLKAYKEKHGHMDVTPKENSQLNDWISWQKSRYVNSKMSKRSLDLLNEFGFDFQTSGLQAKFRQKLKQLVDFHRKTGHFDIPPRYKPDPTLASWVREKREKMRANELPPKQKESLQSIGFK